MTFNIGSPPPLQAAVSAQDSVDSGDRGLTFHLHKVQLVNGLQQGAVVQAQVKVRGHPGGERAFPPLVLSQVDSPDEGV